MFVSIPERISCDYTPWANTSSDMKNLFFGLNYEKKNSHVIDKLQQPSPLSQHQRRFVLVVFVVALTFNLFVCLFVFSVGQALDRQGS